MIPAFVYSLYLTLFKKDISLRRTLGASPKGVRLGESWLYIYGEPLISLEVPLRCKIMRRQYGEFELNSPI